jgi:DNA-binding GntR family transcriptional regulator
MKSDTIFKRACIDALDLLRRYRPGGTMPSEVQLCQALDVCRTTVRKVLRGLAQAGLITDPARKRRTAMACPLDGRHDVAETIPRSKHFEQGFMAYFLYGNARPGMLLNELELARRFGVAAAMVREFLNQFQRVGLIEKRPNGRWVVKGFTVRFATELLESREMLWLRSAKLLAELSPDDPVWAALASLRSQHEAL